MNVPEEIKNSFLNALHLKDYSIKKEGFFNTTPAGVSIVPVKQHQFVVYANMDLRSPLLLKSFDIPSAGISFSSSEEHLFFSEPKIEVPSASFTAYLPTADIRTSIAQLYYNQFSHGLLSLKRGAIFDFYILDWMEDENVSLAKDLKASEGVSQTVAMSVLKDSSMILGAALQAPDIIQDQYIAIARAAEAMARKEWVLTLKDCKISAPKFSPDPASNEFATVQLTVNYNDFKTI